MSLSEDLFSTWRPACCGKWTESRRSLPPKTCASAATSRRHANIEIWTVTASAPAPKTGGDMERSAGAELRLDVRDLLICSGNCVSASDEAARQVRPLEQLAHRVARPC